LHLTQQQTHAAAIGVLLGETVGDLGERLAGRDPDRYRNPGPLSHGAAQLAGMGFKACLEAGEAKERFVDRVDFQIGREARDRAHHATAHVAVERVIRAADDDTGRFEAVAAQVPRVAHHDAERLGLIAAGDHAAIIV
jgi:hypothetical protein